MSSLLLAFLLVLVVPLLVATWRTSLIGLGLQGALMVAVAAERGWPTSASGVVLLVDLLVVRTYLAPRWLYAVMAARRAPARSDVIPPNLLSWALAGTLVLLAFRFADRMSPGGGVAALHLAVAASGLLLGLLVLGTRNTTFSQMVGALRIENSIALFELASGQVLPLPVQLAVSAILVLTVLAFGAALRQLGPAATGEEAS